MGEVAMGSVRLDSFAEFYRASFTRTVQVVRPIVGAFAEDVAQEAFIAALMQWEHVAVLQSPESWVHFVARRIARRRGHREASRPVAEWGTKVERGGVDIDVRSAVDRLATRSREAILLRYVSDCTLREVAERLQCPETAARVLVFRARQQLAEPLSGLSGTWMGDRRWTVDETARQLVSTGDVQYRDIVLSNTGTNEVRRVLTLDYGRYLLANDDGKQLDHGTFRFRGDSLTLVPWNGGTVDFRTTIDGDVARFRQISNSTAPTDGVPDHVYMRLLLESEPLVWRGRTRQGSSCGAREKAHM